MALGKRNLPWFISLGFLLLAVCLFFAPPVLGAKPVGVLTVTPTNGLAASGFVGGPFSPFSQVYALSNSGTASLSWEARRDQNWVGLSATNGTLSVGASTTVTVSINANANALAAGSYSDTVTFTNVTNGNGTTNRSLSLTVTGIAVLGVTPSVTVCGSVFGDASGGQSFGSVVTGQTYSYQASGCIGINVGCGGPCNTDDPDGNEYSNAGCSGTSTVQVTNANFLCPSLIAHSLVGQVNGTCVQLGKNGTFTTPTSGTLILYVNDDIYGDNSGSWNVCVSTPVGLASSGTVGGPFSPPSQAYTLTNSGTGVLRWSASNSQGWVSLSATGGTLAVGASTTVIVSINSNANALAEGSYSDAVTFANLSNGNGTTVAQVELTAIGVAALAVGPANGLSSSGSVGGPFTPSSQVYSLTNSGSAALGWSAGKGQSWVSLSATGGTLAVGASTTVTVSINSNASVLAIGNYSDTVTFSNLTNGNGTTTRGVSLAVTGIPVLGVTPSTTNVCGTVVGIDSGGDPFGNVVAGQVYGFQASGCIGLNVGCNGPCSTADPDGNNYIGASCSGTPTNSPANANYPCPSLLGHSLVGQVNGTCIQLGKNGSFTAPSTGPLTLYFNDDIYGDNSGSWSVCITTPATFAFGGPLGGPFSPSSQVYTLTNSGTGVLAWSAGNTAPWVSLSAASGTLAGGASTTVAVSINSNANALTVGTYSNTVTFTNLTNGNGTTTRSVVLSVLPVLDHFSFSTIASPQIPGAPFAITITARDTTNGVFTGFTGTVALSGKKPGLSGGSVPVPVSPTNTTAFTAGQWTGSVTVGASGTNVTLIADDGAGHTGMSNPFNVQVGALDHFVWSAISSPQHQDTPFSVTITAKDIGNNTVSNFAGTVYLSAFGGSASAVFAANFESGLGGFTVTNTFGNGNGLWHLSTGRATDPGHSPSNSLYYGQNEGPSGGGNYDTSGIANEGVVTSSTIDLTTQTGPLTLSFNYLLQTEGNSFYDHATVEVSQNGGPFTVVASNNQGGAPLTDPTSGAWLPAATSLSSYTNSQIRLRFHFNTGDGILNDFEGWYVDDVVISNASSSVPVPISPTNSSAFVNGAWVGSVSVLDVASNVVLVASDGAGHSGTSTQFIVLASADMAAAMTGLPNPVTVGNNLTYSIAVTNKGPDTASQVVLTDPLPAGVTFVSALPSQGTITVVGNTVSCSLGVISNGAAATATIVVKPTTLGTLSNSVTVTSSATDSNLADNVATTITSVQGIGVLAVITPGAFIGTSICDTVPGGDPGGASFGDIIAGQTYLYQASGCVERNLDGAFNDPDGKTYKNPCVTLVSGPTNAPADFLCPGLMSYSLVGKVGGTCIQLGSNGSFVAPASGALTLYFNDNIYSDNNGSWDVCVTPIVGQICTNLPGAASGGVSIGTVAAGQTYGYSASGCVEDSFSSGHSEDPDGHIYTNGCTMLWSNGVIAGADNICPGLTAFSLVGKIDGGSCLQLGSSGSFVAPTSGTLVLYFNDDIFGDNSGSWNVCVGSSSDLAASGPQGGPFTPPSQLYTLTNSGTGALMWSASVNDNWLTLSATNGTLAAGASAGVTVSINSTANGLVGGFYSSAVSFVNLTTGNGNTNRLVTLLVRDGISDAWRQQYFGHIDPRANDQSRAQDDPDGDGMSNLMEFLAGTDPTNSASYFHIIAVAPSGNDLLVTWMMGPGKTNALQATAGDGSGSYGTNGFADVFIVTNTVGSVTNYPDVGAVTNTPTHFYRVRLVP